MNRMEEYNDLMKELEESVPLLEQTLHRAQRKRNCHNRVIRPLVSLAATFAIFVGLVNYCTPVATAFNQIPIIREMAKAVTFSDSLTDAVNHDYMQPISLTQTDGDVTATIEYVIVDQHQLNVFFRLNSDTYPHIRAFPTAKSADDEHVLSCSYFTHEWDIPNEELQYVTLDFGQDEIPGSLYLELDIVDTDRTSREDLVALTMYNPKTPSLEGVIPENVLPKHVEYVGSLKFLLNFNPEFTANNAKVYSIDKTITLNGNELSFTTMEVYPTHLNVNVTESPKNAEWLDGLDFYVLAEDGTKYEPPRPGLLATGLRDSVNMTSTRSFRAESPYFSDSKKFEIVIKAAEWTNRSTEEIYVNLKTREAEKIPDKLTFLAATEEADGWKLEFRRWSTHYYFPLAVTFYDEEGTAYEVTNRTDGDIGYNRTHFCEIQAPEGHTFEGVSITIDHQYEIPVEEPVILKAK